MAPPKAKAHIHRGTMVAAGMAGADTTITIHTAASVNAKDNGTAGHAQMHGRKVTTLGESWDQFLDRLMWEDSSSHAWTEKEELADLVADKVRSDLSIDGEGSS